MFEDDQQYAKIKVFEKNSCMQAINNNRNNFNLGSGDFIILLKDNNQNFFALAHNLIFYTKTTHINIYYYYICDEMAIKKIELTYILTGKMVNNGLTKPLIYARFHIFYQLNANKLKNLTLRIPTANITF